MTETATIFAGVNQGYQGDNSLITDPVQASAIVGEVIKEIAAASGDQSKYEVRPGFAIYETERGCRHGGEAVGAVLASGKPTNIISTAARLRAYLKQLALSVVLYEKSDAKPSREFSATVTGDLREIALLWQVAAAVYKGQNSVQVSCGMYQAKDGSVIIRAAANPDRVLDIGKWEAAAREVAATVATQAGVRIDLAFRNVGYQHLQSKPA